MRFSGCQRFRCSCFLFLGDNVYYYLWFTFTSLFSTIYFDLYYFPYTSSGTTTVFVTVLFPMLIVTGNDTVIVPFLTFLIWKSITAQIFLETLELVTGSLILASKHTVFLITVISFETQHTRMGH